MWLQRQRRPRFLIVDSIIHFIFSPLYDLLDWVFRVMLDRWWFSAWRTADADLDSLQSLFIEQQQNPPSTASYITFAQIGLRYCGTSPAYEAMVRPGNPSLLCFSSCTHPRCTFSSFIREFSFLPTLDCLSNWRSQLPWNPSWSIFISLNLRSLISSQHLHGELRNRSSKHDLSSALRIWTRWGYHGGAYTPFALWY